MPRCHLDHITVTAPELVVGVEYVRRVLGVMPEVGGEHPRMGTHNFFLRLGDAVYLEVIAPNPSAPKPERPRWFELDHQDLNAPRLATWVARTSDMRATLAAASEPLGNAEPMTRGQARWLMAIPADGSLPMNGIAPTLIEWHTERPTAKLRDAGCSLVRLEAFHTEAHRISALLKSISAEGEISVVPLPAGERPYLVAHIQTPGGLKKLSGS